MFLPPQYQWLEPTIIAAIVVFIIAWIGNSITGNRIVNAFVTALIFGLVLAALTYSGYHVIDIPNFPSPAAPPR